MGRLHRHGVLQPVQCYWHIVAERAQPIRGKGIKNLFDPSFQTDYFMPLKYHGWSSQVKDAESELKSVKEDQLMLIGCERLRVGWRRPLRPIASTVLRAIG